MNTTTVGRRISAGLSLYLDLVRFAAAVFVVLYHTWDVVFPHQHFKWPGHEAVVVFFVLSGYVIAHVASAPGTDWTTYVQHRVARILPVAYAALLLGLGISLLRPDLYKDGSLWWSTLSNALFVAQSGPLSLEAPLNPPFWSLNYEVWYYVIYGIWVFSLPKRRMPLAIAAALLAGPKILMLFPVWLFGVALYHRMPAWKPALAWFCFIASLVAGALLTWCDVSDFLRDRLYAAIPAAWHAHYSTQFLYDLLLGVVVAIHFTAVASLPDLTRYLTRVTTAIRCLAGCTFTLYVFHGPLMILFQKVVGINSPLPFYGAIAVSVTILAALTERRVKWYRGLVGNLLEHFRRPPSRVMPKELSGDHRAMSCPDAGNAQQLTSSHE